MKQDFKHFLITRFNIPLKNWNKDKSGSTVLNDAWMNERLELFEKYCVPTILQQTNHDFTWLIYLFTDTPGNNIESIKNIIQKTSNAEIRFVNDFEELLVDLRKLFFEVETEYIISSRLDNDDGLGKNYIQYVQEAFIPEDKTILNLPTGVLYDRNKKILTVLRNMQLNHYGSLIEKQNLNLSLLTILGFSHNQPPGECKVINLDTPVSWLKIIHKRNLNSRIKGKPILIKDIWPYFNLNKKDFPVSLLNVAHYIIGRIFQKLIK